MKKKPYPSRTGVIQDTGTRGNALISTPAISNTKATQRIRPLSLRLPKSGLLITEAIKIPEIISPVSFGLNPCALCRKREAEVPIALPAKSRKLNAKLAPKKKNQRAAVGKSFWDTDPTGSERL